MTLASDLQAAYDRLERTGWCQGKFLLGAELTAVGGYAPSVIASAPVCLDAALRTGPGFELNGLLQITSATDDDRLHAMIRLLASLLPPSVLPDLSALWVWNDEPGRSVEDVKLLLKHGIAKAQDAA